MTYQWNAGTNFFEGDTWSVGVSAQHVATGFTFSFTGVQVLELGFSDPNVPAVLGAMKEALEAGGFTNVSIQNSGFSIRDLEEV